VAGVEDFAARVPVVSLRLLPFAADFAGAVLLRSVLAGSLLAAAFAGVFAGVFAGSTGAAISTPCNKAPRPRPKPLFFVVAT